MMEVFIFKINQKLKSNCDIKKGHQIRRKLFIGMKIIKTIEHHINKVQVNKIISRFLIQFIMMTMETRNM